MSIYVCTKQFNARLGDELNLKVGDKVEVLADDSEYNDGWYMGKNLLTNEVGLYPKTFTQVLPNQGSETSVLRSRSRRLGSGHSSAANTPPVTSTAQLGDSFEKLSVNSMKTATPKGAAQVTKTMTDIDKALEELQTNSFSETSRTPSGNPSHARQPSLQSLTEDLNPADALKWTPQQVSLYFAIVLGFDMDVAGKFARHKITGEILFQLDLAHLKELDIDSFGTRFEIYKEIEKLRTSGKPKSAQVSENHEGASSRSFPSNNSDESLNIDLLTSSVQSRLLLPLAELNLRGQPKTHQRKRSQSMENLLSPTTPLVGAGDSPESFLSPRKAPEPPSASPLNKGYRFGGSPRETLQSGLYLTRTNASSAGLGISNGASRPASSVYDNSMASQHRRNSSVISGHRRHSSMFSFLSGANDEQKEKEEREEKRLQSNNIYRDEEPPQLISPAKVLRLRSKSTKIDDLDDLDVDLATFSPHKSKSLKEGALRKSTSLHNHLLIKDEKRAASDSTTQSSVLRLKTLRTASTQNFKSLTGSKKSKTSAFQEGIREVTPDEAIKSATHSGWMAKKSGSTIGWRSRYFTLHGTRLSYFTSLKDKKEKGLIDITAHKVIPVNSEDANNTNDKYIALYAASTGFGRYCFKLVPPAPGFKKGLTFTQPKTHYFAVETMEEMRGWLKALMTATIDIDDSVPVVSLCLTPTVSLAKAQEMLARAREETKLKDEELRARGAFDGFDEYGLNDFLGQFFDTTVTSEENSPIVDSLDESTLSSVQRASSRKHPKLTVDTSGKTPIKGPTTPLMTTNQGFASPYLLASGLLSPKLGASPGTPKERPEFFDRTDSKGKVERVASKADSRDSDSRTESKNSDKLDNSSSNTGETTPKQVFSNSNGRVLSGSKKKNDKMLAYASDGSGNHTFVIKKK